ncbi:LWXIA domain-containing protein [Cupriavidus campinensis]
MLDFMDAIRAAAAAAARAAAEAAERAREAAERAAREAQEQAQRRAQQEAAARAQKPQQAEPPKQPPKTAQTEKPQVINAVYTGNEPVTLTLASAPKSDQPAQTAPPPDPAETRRKQEADDAKALTDRWEKDAKGAYDDTVDKLDGDEMTDDKWKPLGEKYGTVLGGVQNELRVAANHAAQTGKDVNAAVDAKAKEIGDRYKDPVLKANLEDAKTDYLKTEPTQAARDTGAARFKVVLAQEKADGTAAKVKQEEAAYLKIPGGVRRFETGLDDDLQAARAADRTAQQDLVNANNAFLGTLQKEIDTTAVNLYKTDSDKSLTAARNDRTPNSFIRQEGVSIASANVSDANGQLQALSKGEGVKVPERFRDQAAADLKARYGANEQFGAVIDLANAKGQLKGEMNHLMPANDFERGLAKTDPTTLAMARMEGLTLDPDAKTDPNSVLTRDMPADERRLMKENPAGYVLYKSLGADGLRPDPDAKAGDPATTKYNQGVQKAGGLLPYTVEQLTATANDKAAKPEDKAAAKQGLQKMFGLMQASTDLRVDTMTTTIKKQLDAGDINGALATRKAGVDAAQTPEERAQYVAVHNDRFNGDLFKSQINAAMDKNLKNKTQDKDGRPIPGQQAMYADKVGQYLQKVAPNLIPEDAATLLNTVKSEYRNNWTARNDSTGAGYNDWDDFYHGLAAVVDKADANYYATTAGAKPGSGPAAQSTAAWLTDRHNDVSLLMMSNQSGSSRQGRIYGGAQDAAAHGYTGLSTAFEQALKSSKDAPPMSDYYVQKATARGMEKYGQTEQAQEQTKLFELDKDEILRQTFDSLSMQKQDLTAKVGDDKALDKAISLAAPNASPAAVKDIKDEIRANAGNGVSVSAIPIFVTQPGSAPYQSAVFEFKGRDGNTMWVDDSGSIYGKHGTDPKRDFQENNLLADKGTVYIADRNLDLGKDGHVGYQSMDAHIVTTSEKVMGWVNLGVAAFGAVAGGVLVVASGGTLTPLVGAAWVGMAASMGYGIGTSWHELDNIADHGRSVNPFKSQEAMSQWLNITGSVAGMGGMGVAKFGSMAANAGVRMAASGGTVRQIAGDMLTQSASRFGTASRVLNGTAFGVGGVQTMQQASAFAQHGKDMSVSEIVQNSAMLLMGATQMLPMAIQKRVGESVRDTYQRTRGRTPMDDTANSPANRTADSEAARVLADGEAAALPRAARDAEGPASRPRLHDDASAPGQRPAGRDGESGVPATAGRPRTQADTGGQPGRGGRTGQPANTPEGAPARAGADAPPNRLAPYKLTAWQSMQLRGNLVQDRVIANMMDRALARAQERYRVDTDGRRRESVEAAERRVENAAAERRRIRQSPALARRGHMDGEGAGAAQRRTIHHGPEAEAPLSLRQNAISPLDSVLWIDGQMEQIGVPYGAEVAARAVADLDRVMIVTGPLTVHGHAETNGVIGAASLGSYLASLGKEVVYVTDRAHARALRKMLRNDLDQPNARVETFSARDHLAATLQSRALLAMHQPEAVIAVEVAGRNLNNEYRLQTGEAVAGRPRIDQLLVDARDMKNVVTVAVGDHGNEAGMRTVRERIQRGMPPEDVHAELWSDLSADHVVTGMNSNLAAQAIGFAIQRYKGAGQMPKTEQVGNMLDTMAGFHARDGVTHEVGATSVRGMDKSVQVGVYELLGKAAESLPDGLDFVKLFDGIQRRFLPKDVDAESAGIRVEDDVIVVTAFDSSNGGLLAAQNLARHIYALTGKAVQVEAVTDHAAGTYGGRSPEDLAAKVHAGLQAVQKLEGDVNLAACNTACLALPTVLARMHGFEMVNLIQQTVPQIVTLGGERPVVIATPGTVGDHAYLEGVREFSGGRKTVKEIPAREWADAVNNLMHLDDGAQLAQLKQWIADYINPAEIPADTTSVWFCCTHYPALESLVRQRLDAIDRSHVKLIDPMQFQARKAVDILIDKGVLDRGDLLETPLDPMQVPDSKTLPTIVVTSGQPSAVSRLAHAMGGRPDIRVFKSPFGEAADVSGVRALVDAGRHLDAVDRVSFSYIGRGLREFYMPGGAQRAAASLESGENVMLLTGFSVDKGMPETDGPPGTAELGRALRLRGKQVTYVVDSANKPILEAILREMGEPLDNIKVFDVPVGDAKAPARALLDAIRPDRVMAIELPSRSVDGTKNNMRGLVIDGFNPAIDEILLQANAREGVETLGVGDGGNEVGMGGLKGLIPLAKNGKPMAAEVTADHVVTASVSNWAAYGVAALMLKRGNMIDRFQSPGELRRVLQAAADAGAVDGVSRERVPTVDGFSTDVHAAIIQLYRHAATGELPVGPGAAPTPFGGPGVARTAVAEAAHAVVEHGGQMPAGGTGAPRPRPAGTRRTQAAPVHDGSWSLRDATTDAGAMAATVDGVHASGGRLDGVHYVVLPAAGGDVAVRNGLPESAHDSMQQALAAVDEAVQAGQPVQIAVVAQRTFQGKVGDGNLIGTVPVTLHGRSARAGGIALNPAYTGDIRVALPDGFRADAPLIRQEGGRRVDHLGQLEQFPRGPAHLDLAQEAGQVTFDNTAVGVSVPRIPGHFTIRAEALFGGVEMNASGKGPSRIIDAAAVIARVRAHPDYVEGMPVVLYGCYGQDGVVSLVQQLADGLNARVYGADGRVDIDAFLSPGSDLAHGARVGVVADRATMAKSGADLHVVNGGRFSGAMPSLPIVGVTHGGRPAAQHAGGRAAQAAQGARGGDPVPAGWRQQPSRWAEVAIGDKPHRVNAPRDHAVVVGAIHPDGGVRGDDGNPIGAHELAFRLADEWEAGQPIVLALDGAHAPQGRVFAQRVADVMQTEVLVPEFALQRQADTAEPGKRAIDLAQAGGKWRRLAPQPDPYANHRFDINARGTVYLRQPDGTRERVDLARYLGPRLGSGGAKTVFALGSDKAVGIASDEMTGFMVRGEREALRTAAGLGFNTLKSYGPDDMTVFGRPAVAYERYAASSKDLFADKTVRAAPDPRTQLLNGKSLQDLDQILDTMADRHVYLGDVEFSIHADGAVKVADLTHVEMKVDASQGSAHADIVARMRDVARANEAAGQGGTAQRGTVSHGGATPAAQGGRRPWKMSTTLSVSTVGTFALGTLAGVATSAAHVNPVISSAACFIYRGSVAAGRTLHTQRIVRRAASHAPADIAYLKSALYGKRADMWGIHGTEQQAFRKAVVKLEAYSHGALKDSPRSAEKIGEAQAVIATVGAKLLHPDTAAGRANDAAQIGTLAVNNSNTAIWFMQHQLPADNPLTYSNAAFLASNTVLSTFNIANRLGHHLGGKPTALLGAQMRKFVMNGYALGMMPLAVADAMNTPGVVGGLEAAGIAVFGVGAHLQSRNEQKVIAAEKNKLAVAQDPDATLRPEVPWAARKWQFFGKAMPYGLVLLGAGVVVNFVAKIAVELTRDDDKAKTPGPVPASTTSPSPTGSQPPTQVPPDGTKPEVPPRTRPTTPETVRVQPYRGGNREISTLWGIARTHLDTLLSEEQKTEARDKAMSPDTQVGNFALRELINLNPKYNLGENPGHIEPGWEFDVTR